MAGESCSEFVKSVCDLLKNGDTANALDVFSATKNFTEVKNNSWDLIPVITQFITSDCYKNNADIFKCCKTLINIIGNNSNPEEALLQFIEEIEECKDDTTFITLLEPIQKILIRVPKKRLNSLAWCFSAIQTFLNSCEIPEDKHFTRKEQRIIDSTEKYERIIKLYRELLVFYDSVVKEIVSNSEDIGECAKVVSKFLIQLLGKPFIYLDMEVFNSVKSKARLVAENLVRQILRYFYNPILLLEMQSETKNNDLLKPNSLSLAALFYLVYAEGIFIEKVPQVYNPQYFFHISLYLVTELINIEHQSILVKGLKLASTLLSYIKFSELPYLMLDSGHHSKFCESLAKVIVYNQVETIRKSALDIYKNYLNSFESRGFYLLVYNLMSLLKHSGLIGFTITQYKEQLVKEFSNKEKELSIFFKGQKLLVLIQKFCHLPKNEESDLIQMSDPIIATLNLLRYLALRDKNNATQIWEYFELLGEIYFRHLRKGIDISRAHYELKVKEIQEKPILKNQRDPDVSIVVSGENLMELPKQEKLQVLNASMTTLDVIDSLLSRLTECIELSR